jgi:hypothetical protein
MERELQKIGESSEKQSRRGFGDNNKCCRGDRRVFTGVLKLEQDGEAFSAMYGFLGPSARV